MYLVSYQILYSILYDADRAEMIFIIITITIDFVVKFMLRSSAGNVGQLAHIDQTINYQPNDVIRMELQFRIRVPGARETTHDVICAVHYMHLIKSIHYRLISFVQLNFLFKFSQTIFQI